MKIQGKGSRKTSMKILISNDDGILAPGLKVLAKTLSKLGRVVVVAPNEEKSTMGHALTLHKPLRIQEMEPGFFSINGSPADCVYMGIREVLKSMPDLVISGPNRGGNLGQDIYYSGTVSAAREACILGLPAVALSVDVMHGKAKGKPIAVQYAAASEFLLHYLKKFDFTSLPRHTLLNINVPNVARTKYKGIRFTRLGFRHYSGTVVRRIDHRGRPYFWVGGQYKGFANVKGTDCEAVASGYVSITPVQLDCTNHRFLGDLQEDAGL
jgi:5'-nucleotidase